MRRGLFKGRTAILIACVARCGGHTAAGEMADAAAGVSDAPDSASACSEASGAGMVVEIGAAVPCESRQEIDCFLVLPIGSPRDAGGPQQNADAVVSNLASLCGISLADNEIDITFENSCAVSLRLHGAAVSALHCMQSELATERFPCTVGATCGRAGVFARSGSD